MCRESLTYGNVRCSDGHTTHQTILNELLTVRKLLFPAVLEHLGETFQSDHITGKVARLKNNK